MPSAGDENTPALPVLHVLAGAARGGCERNSLNFCLHYRKRPHEVVVLGQPGPMSAEWAAAGAEVTHLPAGSALTRGPRGTQTLRALLGGRCAAGVILWHGMVELPRLLHVLPASVGPVLVHGGNPATDLRKLTDLRYLAAGKLWPPNHDPLYVCCSRHVACSFDSSRYLRRFRRCVVPNGVAPGSDVIREPRPLPAGPDGEVTIGMIARLDAIKDHATLLRAFAEVGRAVPGARLELAGDGEAESALRALAAELGLSKKVRFLGMVEDVNAAMRGWDLFAYAATPREGFGNAVAEALMAGLPAVLSDLAPLREVCGGAAGNVVYVPATDPRAMAAALLRLIPDLEERRRLGAAAHRHARSELGADIFAARYAALLEEERRRLGRKREELST